MEDRIKSRARYKSAYAIKTGKLVRGSCEVCGTTERIHGHHDDYSEPLKVRWLCATHHRKFHAKRWFLKTIEASKHMKTELDDKLAKLAAIVSAEEIAAILRVTRQSVYRWANEGRLPCLQPGERIMRFRKEDVIAFIENSYLDK